MDFDETNRRRKEAAPTTPKRWRIFGGYDGARHALFVRQDGPWLDPGGATVEVAPALEVSSYRAALQNLVRACPDWMKSGADASPAMSRAIGLLAAWSGPEFGAGVVERLAERLSEEINPEESWEDLVREGNPCVDAIRNRAKSYLDLIQAGGSR